jgi:hypothetical protein
MNVAILQGIVFIAVTVVGLGAWKKYADKDYLWLSLIAVIGASLKVFDYASERVLSLPQVVLVVASVISLLAWIGLIVMVAKIVLGKQK